ncbi:MAG: NAD-dependent epimerase/dehydratase family protein [Deltaproteobacteria bacterium]|nr:NAD-dependent epimerase/dehydratase family protein [Deltaproteobacteria bacterium]
MRALITGVAGPRGRALAVYLLAQGHEVVGVDTEPWPDAPPGVELHALDLCKRGFENLVRGCGAQALVHLAIHAGLRLPPALRRQLNLEGSQRVFDLAARHGVRKLVVASHATIYGALPDGPCFVTEQAPPAVGRAWPEMQDVVAADLLAGTAMWQHPQMEIAVLRPVHTLGPSSRDVLALVLRRRFVPAVLGFDPMIQVVHQDDLCRAYALALAPAVRGVYNVAGPGEVPLSILIRASGARRIALPEAVIQRLRGRFGLPHVEPGAIEFLKHPCLVDGSRFAREAGYAPQRSLVETVKAAGAARES